MKVLHPHHRRRLVRLLSVSLTAAAVGLWLAFAPVALGGSATYVTTYGTSMEPTLHRGDLAVVRPQPSYRVGEIVAYRSESLRTVVLHRIIGHDGERFVVKGDNNTWTDSDRPDLSHIVGRMELRLAGVGANLQRVASPPGIAALAGMAAFPVGVTRRKRRGARRAIAAPGTATVSSSIPWGPVDQRLVLATAVVAILAAMAFTKPLGVSGTADLAFEERGQFSYTAAAPSAPAVYPSGGVETGQPVFLNVVQELQIDFDYATSSTQPIATEGELRLRAEVRDANGWSRAFDLASPVAVSDGSGRASGSLNLRDVRAALTEMEAASGVHRNAYTLSVQATTTRLARYGTTTDDGVFAASLDFELTDLELHLAGGAGARDALAPSQGSLISVPVERQNHLELLGRPVPIAGLRAAALALVVLVGAAWLDWLVRGRRGDESTRIALRYRSYLMRVRELAADPAHTTEVTSMADLAKLADRVGAPVLHDAAGVYQVVDGDQTYRYTLAGVLP